MPQSPLDLFCPLNLLSRRSRDSEGSDATDMAIQIPSLCQSCIVYSVRFYVVANRFYSGERVPATPVRCCTLIRSKRHRQIYLRSSSIPAIPASQTDYLVEDLFGSVFPPYSSKAVKGLRCSIPSLQRLSPINPTKHLPRQPLLFQHPCEATSN